MLQDIDLVNWKSCATNQFGRKEIGKKKTGRKSSSCCMALAFSDVCLVLVHSNGEPFSFYNIIMWWHIVPSPSSPSHLFLLSPAFSSHSSFPVLLCLSSTSLHLLLSAGANEVLIQNFRNQVEEFKMKGRYQETQQNLAIFAIKERYVECDNLYDFFFFFLQYTLHPLNPPYLFF